jgi:glycolate oxidase
VPARLPDAVIRVRGTRDVVAVMRAASRHRIPVTPRGGGTGRTGGAVPVFGGIVLAFDRMIDVKGIEQGDLLAVVEPGVVTGVLHETVERDGLFYPPDPNSLGTCTIGGNVAENAGGPRAFRYGVTREYVLGMECVTADGTVLKLGKRTVKGVTGYDLCALVVGSEGTLAIVTEVTLKLIPKPEAVRTMLVMLADEAAVERAVSAAVRRGVVPRCVELLDSETIDVLRPDAAIPIPERARAMLVVERDGLWSARREMARSLRQRAKFKISEDVVVPRSKIAALLIRSREIAAREGLRTATYGHAGDGNLHVNYLWDDESQEPAMHRAVKSLFESVVEMGGTLSGEHGIGVLKAPYLGLEQSPELIALQERVKQLFDPKGVLNPGKIFPSAVRGFHGAC